MYFSCKVEKLNSCPHVLFHLLPLATVSQFTWLFRLFKWSSAWCGVFDRITAVIWSLEIRLTHPDLSPILQCVCVCRPVNMIYFYIGALFQNGSDVKQCEQKTGDNKHGVSQRETKREFCGEDEPNLPLIEMKTQSDKIRSWFESDKKCLSPHTHIFPKKSRKWTETCKLRFFFQWPHVWSARKHIRSNCSQLSDFHGHVNWPTDSSV